MANFENLKKLTDVDMINKPPHYNREGAMECIDEMIMIFGEEAVKHFCLCNAWKYRYRAADKNGKEDLKKSDWYMQKYRELNEHPKSESSWTISTTPAVVENPNPQMIYL